ncbi:MAG: HDOD domain-containing protein [Planctomycetes bacterium]|nr:HDOD domain-containing protein [Planctomycetota bacterium]
MTRVLDLIRTLRTTPPLPSVAFRILEVVRDPDYSIDTLVDLVRTDPSLTARVLRLTNSALFGVPNEITSVGDAVSYVGTRNLVKLVLVCCAANHFRQASTSIYGDPGTLWRHSFAVATASQWIARRCGYAETDTAFTAGILHNVGKVALSQAMDDTVPNVVTPQESHCATEAEMFGIDHAAAAGVVAGTWSLPRELTMAIRNHHSEREVAKHALAAILGLADDLVLGLGIGNPFPSIELRPSALAMERLQLTAEDLENAGAHVRTELEQNTELLNLNGVSNR